MVILLPGWKLPGGGFVAAEFSHSPCAEGKSSVSLPLEAEFSESSVKTRGG